MPRVGGKRKSQGRVEVRQQLVYLIIEKDKKFIGLWEKKMWSSMSILSFLKAPRDRRLIYFCALGMLMHARMMLQSSLDTNN